jgi:hypothetical protein
MRARMIAEIRVSPFKARDTVDGATPAALASVTMVVRRGATSSMPASYQCLRDAQTFAHFPRCKNDYVAGFAYLD